MKLNIEKLVTFCILMESDDGILGKAPDYIQEKFEACQSCTEDWMIKQMLDSGNGSKFDRWVERWSI